MLSECIYTSGGESTVGIDAMARLTKSAGSTGITITNTPHKAKAFILVCVSNATGYVLVYDPSVSETSLTYYKNDGTLNDTFTNLTIDITDTSITISAFLLSNAATNLVPYIIY